jgi:hypothetical protein
MSFRFVRGTSRQRARAASTVITVEFMTTASLACRANIGEKGRVNTAITRSSGSGTCLMRPGLPEAAISRSAMVTKPRFSGPPISSSSLDIAPSRARSATRAATSRTETKLMGFTPGPSRGWSPEQLGEFVGAALAAALDEP